MANRINVLVVGGGQVGLGTLDALLDKEEFHKDVLVRGIATRRPEELAEKVEVPIFEYKEPRDLEFLKGVDVAVICNASQSLWYHSKDGKISNEEGLKWASTFPVIVDSFDNHGEMPDYFRAMEEAAKGLTCCSFGWDPGDFSLHKNVETKAFPRSVTNVFYGPGKSQGHTTALKTDPTLRELSLRDALQITMPREDTLARVRAGEMRAFTAGERLWRDCYVLAEANHEEITKYIQSMKDYFEGYETKVTFVSPEEMTILNQRREHRGLVITTGTTRNGSRIRTERLVEFESNAAATGCLLAAAAVAGYKSYQQGKRGAFGPGDFGENLFSYLPRQEIIGKGL